jgi:integrase
LPDRNFLTDADAAAFERRTLEVQNRDRRDGLAQRDRRLLGDEEGRLLAAADLYTEDLIVAALETGCRGGELRSLQWHDVQDDVLVLTAEKTKTKRKCLIPISPTLRNVLDRRRKGPEAVELPAIVHVFGNAVGGAHPAAGMIDDLHFHDLRHEFGSQLLEAGGELHEVQATLGHRNIKMTSTYLNATTQGVKQAFKKLEATPSSEHQGRSWPADGPRLMNVFATITTVSACACDT